jgi:hypothetical protein
VVLINNKKNNTINQKNNQPTTNAAPKKINKITKNKEINKYNINKSKITNNYVNN